MLAELSRILRAGGVAYLDFPNGSFPIDFWRGFTRLPALLYPYLVISLRGRASITTPRGSS